MNHYFIIISEETSLSIWPKVVSDTCSEAFQCFRCSGKSKQCNILYHIAYFSGVVLIPLVDAEEAVVLARWLETICLDVASRDPTDEHKAFLDYFTSALQKTAGQCFPVSEATGSGVYQSRGYEEGIKFPLEWLLGSDTCKPGSSSTGKLPLPQCSQLILV